MKFMFSASGQKRRAVCNLELLLGTRSWKKAEEVARSLGCMLWGDANQIADRFAQSLPMKRYWACKATETREWIEVW